MSDYPLVARSVYCDVDCRNRIKMASLGDAVESAVGFCTLIKMNVICGQ